MKASYILSTALAFAVILSLPAHAQRLPPPAPETPAPETPAPETPAPETPAPGSSLLPEVTQPAPAPAPAPEAPPVIVAPEPAEPPEPTVTPVGAVKVKYDKGLSITSEDDMYALSIGVRGQLRAELVRTDAAGELQSRFLIPRLRVPIEGHALGPNHRFKVEFELSGSGNPGLRDYYVDHAFSDALRLRVGQWKKPFNRQELVSDFASEFLERSITNGFVGAGRDLGIALHNGYDRSPEGIEWAAGVFNGTTDRSRQSIVCTDPMDVATCTVTAPSNVPADAGPMLVARVGWNHGAVKGYNEGDLDGGPLRFAVAAGYKVDLQDLAEDADDDLLLQHAAEADFMVKAHGYALSGAAMMIKQGSADPLLGTYAQASAFVLPRQLQVAARVSFLQVNKEMDIDRIETLGAINWFFDGHSYKWMTDAGIVQTTSPDVPDVPDVPNVPNVIDFQARTQLQFLF